MAITEVTRKTETSAAPSARATLEGLYTALNDASNGLGQDKEKAQLDFLSATTKLYQAVAEPEQGRAFQTAREAIATFQEIIPLLGGNANERDPLQKHVLGVYQKLREFAQGVFTEENWQTTQQQLMSTYNVKNLLVATPVEPKPGSEVSKRGMATLQLPSTMEAFLALSKFDKKEVAASGSGAGFWRAAKSMWTGRG